MTGNTTNTNGSKINGTHKWAAIILTIALGVLAITVQWGVVTTKLDHVEKRLDELILEARAMRAEYQSIERRVSFLEGRASGSAPSAGGRQNP